MFEKIINSARNFPNNNAFCINEIYYSYQDTSKRINGIINLIQNSFGRNIGIVVYDDIETYASILAVLLSGKTYVPINPHNPSDRNDNIIAQAEILTVLSSQLKNISDVLSDISAVNVLETSDIVDEKNMLENPEVDFEQNAYILFTSGSTGIPKGVPIRLKNLNSFVSAFFELGYQLDETDRFLQIFDLTFDLSIMSYLIPLTIGACVYTVPSGEIKFTAAYSILEDHEITVALMVPSILSFLQKYYDEIRLEKMKYSLFCGEALYYDLTKGWAECVPNALIQNVYGPTEATIFCLTYNWYRASVNKNINGIVCIGKPMNNILAIIVDSDFKPVAAGVHGELCLSGNQLTAGYINNPEKNREAFFKLIVDGAEQIFYRTGDICYVDEEGDFMFIGRLDNQVKIQGFRVELSEIEHHAREFMKSTNAVALTSQNSDGNTLIHLFIENYNNTEELTAFLKTKLPSYMIPNEIRTLQKFPLNVNGKTDRNALKALI